MSMREYWPNSQFVEECIPVQAERLSAGTLWAVHEPMELLYRSTEGTSVRRTDKEFLSELIANIDGPIPVLGSPGSGKSHLVRWVDSALRQSPNSGRFHIVRIKKNASLRSALESILEGLNSKEFEATRKEVALLQQDQTAITVAEQLVFHMGQQVGLLCQKELADLKQHVSERSTSPTKDERDKANFYRLHGDSKHGLRHLIMDPYFQSTFLKEDTPVFKYASRLVGGSSGAGIDDDEIYEFTDSFNLGHFGFSNLDIPKLSEPARDYLMHSHLHQDSKVASEVVDLLSKSLGVAVKTYFEDAFRYSGGSFQDLFRDIRRFLKQSGKDMFVLVEDLAAIKAISETLIDCLLEDPDEALAPVHSVIASTSGALGYQTTKDTILSRSGGEWVVDVDEQSVAEDELINRTIEMVGRYLNAARVGRGTLDESLEMGETEVPVFSVDSDDIDWDSSDAGYCLYPHTRVSIRELAKVYLNSKNLLTFSPRKVLQKILRPTLRHRPWEGGGFPSRDSYAGVIVSPDLIHESQMNGYTEPVKTALFARIWGGNPSTLGAARNLLSDEVCTELGFKELLDIIPVAPKPWNPTQPESEPEPQPDRPKPAVTSELGRKEFELIDEWLEKKVQLDSRVARFLRQFLSEAFTMRAIPGLHFSSEAFKVETHEVVIPRAIGNPKSGALLTFFDERQLSGNLDFVSSVTKAIVRYLVWQNSSRESYPQLTQDLGVIESFLENWFPSAFEKLTQEQTKHTLDTAKRVAKRFILLGKIKQSTRSSEEKLDSLIDAIREKPSSPDRVRTLKNLHPAIARADGVTMKSVNEVKTVFLNTTGTVPVTMLKKAIRDAEKELSQDDVVVQTFIDSGRELYPFAPIINNFSDSSDEDYFKQAIASLKGLLEHAGRVGRSHDISDLVDIALLKSSSSTYLNSNTIQQQLSLLIHASRAQHEKSLSYFEYAMPLERETLLAFLTFVNEWMKLVEVLEANTQGTGSTLEKDMIQATEEAEALSDTLRSISSLLEGSQV
ncbi:hypothetical protein GCM10011352_04670 [Marinobacterium zhoushanense]|uniref:AAA+ ATPase domain-containing protein n=1 Tax=Marinobacterium zhoushanense TaxID=1679163 RepID=A0ABQ1JY27_9GAMM|nr:protein DpdH [Marinobacterium zhoushanense]GGB81946.1 hypothetical protein GCM10011352_04670 [Marinobacterium zhoushanense]